MYFTTFSVIISGLVVLVPIIRAEVSSADEHISAQPLKRLAFGSCADATTFQQPLWPIIQDYDPQLWIWLGDAIYADMHFNGSSIESPEKTMQDRFYLQKTEAGYAEFIENTQSLKRVLGVWDDHDYGRDDSGKDLEFKHIAKDYYLDFLDEPNTSVRHDREGIYVSYDYGSVVDNNLVRIILLDVRYFRDHMDTPVEERTIIGEEQFQWLEAQLKDSPARVHLIGSGTQIVSDDKSFFLQEELGKKVWFESWGMFPTDRKRLLDLIHKYRTPGVIFLTGDIHWGEMNIWTCSKAGYPLYDLTSSSLSHSAMVLLEKLGIFSFKKDWMYGGIEAHTYHIGDELAASVIWYLGQWLVPHRHRISSYGYVNFGSVDFDWENELITLEITGPGGHRPITKVLELSSLTYSEDYMKQCSASEIAASMLNSYDFNDLEIKVKLCILFGGVMLLICQIFYCIFVKCFCRTLLNPQSNKPAQRIVLAT